MAYVANRARRRTACLLSIACLLCGCGATTFRISGSPTLDAQGKVGAEVVGSFGVGWPLDFSGRSKSYIQGRVTAGGGYDGHKSTDVALGAVELDYIYWAEPSFDVRVGTHIGVRAMPSLTPALTGWGWGGHVALLPVVVQGQSNWIVPQLLFGPEIRVEYKWTGLPQDDTVQLSVPLVLEGTLLAAGD